MKKINVIKCPKCGYEYLPEEIFIPRGFFGNPKTIVRDEEGHIQYYYGNSLDTHEEYICDKCGCGFDVDAKVTFETKVNVQHDFSEDYSTSIYEDRIELDESKVEEKGLW